MTSYPHLRTATAFQRTPKEVFSIVFELATVNRLTQDVQTICLVCRDWYNLAISLPNLWTFLAIASHTTPRRLALWMRRSRDRSLHLVSPAPSADVLKEQRSRHDLQHVLMQVVSRLGTMNMESFLVDEEHRHLLGWVGKLAGQTFPRMETFSMQVSMQGVMFPPTCNLPRLRSLTLGRGTCHWTTIILPIASSTLIAFSLKNVQSTQAIPIGDMLTALRSVPKLEHLRVDEVEWASSDSKDDILPIALPKLVSLSLTAVYDVLNLIRPLQLPVLVELAIGDIDEDLGPVFSDFAQKTSTIQRLTTGLWDEKLAASSQDGLIALLEKQIMLRTLSVGHAPIGNGLIGRLGGLEIDEKASGLLCPKLVSLELPSRVFPQAVQAMVESRSISGMRLDTLALVGEGTNCWDMEGLAPHVRQLEMTFEEGDDDTEENLIV